MAARAPEVLNSFARSLKRLSKKHPELKSAADAALKRAAESGPPDKADKIPGLDGQPVFKERLRLRNQGQRGAARIIYFCDENGDERRVHGLFLFVKGDQEYVHLNEIRDAMKSEGLFEPDKSPLGRGGAQPEK